MSDVVLFGIVSIGIVVVAAVVDVLTAGWRYRAWRRWDRR